jgi:hypothetical protein
MGERRRFGHIHTMGGSQVTVPAEIRGVWLPDKDTKEQLEPPEAKRGKKGLSRSL